MTTNNKNLTCIDQCDDILTELARVEDATYALITELQNSNYWICQSSKRGLLKHRIIDLKYTLTRISKNL